MLGSTYISNPDVWRQFYNDMEEGNVASSRHRKQMGRGIGGMYRYKPYMIPVRPYVKTEERKEIIGRQVTPLAADIERAKVEFKTSVDENVPHVPLESPIKEKVIKSKVSLKRQVKQPTSRNTTHNTAKQNTLKRKIEVNKETPSRNQRVNHLGGSNIFSKIKKTYR